MNHKRRVFRNILLLFVLSCLGSIAYGLYHLNTPDSFAHQFIGCGTVGLFFVAMPIFLFVESKGKEMKDYLLTTENIEKMQKKEPKKKNSLKS